MHHGIAFDTALAPLVRHMPAVEDTRERLQGLQGVWDSLSLLSGLSSTGVEIGAIRTAFTALTGRLVNEVAARARDKAAIAQTAKARAAIDVLVRNLFERTADIGFLACDDDLRGFAAADEGMRADRLPALRQRLAEYRRKYSVYDDVLLLAPDGRVLARLDDAPAPPCTQDHALLDAALAGNAPYVETWRAFDLRPGAARSLLYACRVTDDGGRVPLAVLCLSFRLDDECRRIFDTFVGADDWSVVAVVDGDGRVVASSDPLQLPAGALPSVPDDGRAHAVRFAGRRWLAARCAAQPFQGYAGPGWRGLAMTALEHAFGDDDGATADDGRGDIALAAAMRDSRVLYPQSLRDIAAAAHRIEADLARAVWNGNLALIGAAAAGDTAAAGQTGFSRSLLREIGRTGARTRDGFTAALAQVGADVADAALAGARRRAALAIDIVDRSLYERANDCRWWALATRLRGALDTVAPTAADTAMLETTLQGIHTLYTVYANLVLFDREGRIVAVSRRDDAAAPGRRLDAEWVGRTLALRDTQAYAVSAFEPSALYGGRPTWIYSAAVRALSDPARVVGGIAIVFDSEPQLRAVLHDTLPRDVDGNPLAGAFGVVVDDDGRVLASSHAEPAVGCDLDGDGTLRAAAAAGAGVAAWRGRWYTVGAAASRGYREFMGPDDPYRDRVTALVFEALTDGTDIDVGRDAGAADAAVRPAPALGTDAATSAAAVDVVELATFRIGAQWHAVAGADLVEAVAADRVLPLPGAPRHVRGNVMVRGAPLAVLDAAALLGSPVASGATAAGGRESPAGGREGSTGGVGARSTANAGPGATAAAGGCQIVVLRSPRGGTRFGLVVDALGDNPVVSRTRLVALPPGRWQRGPNGPALIDTLVAPPRRGDGEACRDGDGDGELVTMLSTPALAGLLGL